MDFRGWAWIRSRGSLIRLDLRSIHVIPSNLRCLAFKALMISPMVATRARNRTRVGLNLLSFSLCSKINRAIEVKDLS